MDVVLDTNVLVSALLSPFGAPARVLDLVLDGACRAAYDDRVVAEYRSLLLRPKFRFEARAVDELLVLLMLTGTKVVAPILDVTLPDADDVMFVEVAAGAGAQLITGNRKHFPPAACAGVPIVAPDEFVAWWRKQHA
jgi:putative PIN family toxin of toxin-antitoxin system